MPNLDDFPLATAANMMHELGDGTSYITQSRMDAMGTEFFVWRLQVPSEVLSRADIIAARLRTDQVENIMTRNPSFAYLVYDVSQLIQDQPDGNVYAVRELTPTAENFYMGLTITGETPFLTHVY